MIPNIARRKGIFKRWLRYDGMKHDYVSVKINPENYRQIGETKDGKVKFYTLIK